MLMGAVLETNCGTPSVAALEMNYGKSSGVALGKNCEMSLAADLETIRETSKAGVQTTLALTLSSQPSPNYSIAWTDVLTFR